MKFLVFLACLGGGYFIIRYAKWLIDSTGIRFGFAEGILGGSGTAVVVKLLGLLCIIFGFWYLFN